MEGDSPPKRGIPQPIRGGPVRFGPFFLEARIAVGGTAEVYLARVNPSGPPVGRAPAGERIVVKRLLPHFLSDSEGRTMFEREAILHQSVHHPNVVDVYGSGLCDNGEPYLAMEYVEGVDAYRLLRRFKADGQRGPIEVSVHIVREVLKALASVHNAADANGTPLGIIHRDVTPSNLYLSRSGRVKLGDFGIARSTSRSTMRNAASAMLKGKIAYLAPEQVAGEPFDYRADLFSTASVLAEMLIGKALFPGAGQLAILLAIRDCKIDVLREHRASLPPGLGETVEHALAREPAARFQSAEAFEAALAPFDPAPEQSRQQLAVFVARAQSSRSPEALMATSAASPGPGLPPTAKPPRSPPHKPPPPLPHMRGTAPAMSEDAAELLSIEPEVEIEPDLPSEMPVSSRRVEDVAVPGARMVESLDPEIRSVEISVDELDEARSTPEDNPPESIGGMATAQLMGIPSYVLMSDGTRRGPWDFARLVEALATGEAGRGDQVAYMGRDMQPVEHIQELVRFLPPRSVTTSQVQGPGTPDLLDDLSVTGMLEILLRILDRQETGVLFVEDGEPEPKVGARKELYFAKGKLHHVASSNASELLGEYLVGRGALERGELNAALAVLPKYGGRMGDTLIALGLVGPVDIFRAIREQGRDRVADIFRWQKGTVSFYRGHGSPHVEFPLDLDVTGLLLAGMEALYPGDSMVTVRAADMERRVIKGAADRPGLIRSVKWPPVVTSLVATCTPGALTLAEVVKRSTASGTQSVADVLRAMEIAIGAHLLALG